MANCGGTQQSNGTGQGKTVMIAMKKAFAHLLLNGKALCAQKTCDSGNCDFGITADQFQALEWSDPMQVGDEVRISVSGEGTCFCN
jgi:hypothetical protein